MKNSSSICSNGKCAASFRIPNYPDVEASCDIVDWQEMMHYIDDALGMCAGLSSFPLKPPYHIHNYPCSSPRRREWNSTKPG